MRKIFFDLDGTLIDSKKRLYQLFQDLIPESTLSFDEYWGLKSHKVNHQTILAEKFPQYDFDTFNQKWLSLIETEKYLKLDTVYLNVKEVLTTLGKEKELFVLTARQDKEMLYKQLSWLGLTPYFKEILATENKQTKTDILKQFSLTSDDILVGDTGHDIQTGKSVGLKTVAVSYGFLSEEVLKTYQPDTICAQAKDWLFLMKEKNEKLDK